MGELVVTCILIGVSVLVIAAMVLLYVLLKSWKKTAPLFSLFQPDEEKSVLTRAEHRPAKMVL